MKMLRLYSLEEFEQKPHINQIFNDEMYDYDQQEENDFKVVTANVEVNEKQNINFYRYFFVKVKDFN